LTRYVVLATIYMCGIENVPTVPIVPFLAVVSCLYGLK